MKEENLLKKVLDDFGDLKYVFVIMVVGLILGGITIYNQKQTNDESIYSTRAINFMNSGVTSTIDQGPLYAYITDLSYKLFGVSIQSSRFPVLFFGFILVLFMVYVIGKNIYNSKVGILAAALLSVSNYYLRFLISQPDQIMVLYSLLSMYFFIKSLKEKKFIYLSFIFLALSILIKTFAALFFVSYIVFAVVWHFKDKENSFFKKEHINKLIICGLILFFAATPIFFYNFMIYKESGTVDLLFNRFLGMKLDVYSGLGGAETGIVLSDVPKGIKVAWSFFWQYDKILFTLSIFGLILLFYRKNIYSIFLFLCILFLFLFLSSTSLLDNHFIVFLPIMSLFAGYFLYNLFSFISKKAGRKISYSILLLFLIMVVFINVKAGSYYLFTRWDNPILRDYVSENIGENDLVVVDTRMYRGYVAFIFNDKKYIESVHLGEALNQLEQQRNSIPQKAFLIECIQGDCGWGNVGKELNDSTNELIKSVSNIATNKKTIYVNQKPTFNVYSFVLNTSAYAGQLFDSTHYFYYTPVGWKNPRQNDNYEVDEFYEKILNIFSYLILYLELLLMIILPFWSFYYFYIKGEI